MSDSIWPTDAPLSRRDALGRVARGAVALAVGCAPGPTPAATGGTGRLRARPGTPTSTVTAGLHQLGLGGARDGLLYVPAAYRPDAAAPLALLFHGAGQDASEMVEPMREFADEVGLVLVAPDSRGSTWDAIRGIYGPDVAFVDGALTNVFAHVRADRARLGVAGFSDGATYALSLGRINGDLFGRVAAFSPGFVVSGTPTGNPKFFITHGTRDMILPIDNTSRRIVPALRAAGYDVEYHEFDGRHGISTELLHQATGWLAA